MKKVSFIGAGAMAEAIIAGIIEDGVLEAKQICVTNKSNQARLEQLSTQYGVIGNSDQEEVIQDANIIIMATKPHDIDAALQNIAPFIHPEQLIISVLAGVSTETIVESIGKDIPVVRTMPNTSATVGQSATAICKGQFASEDHIVQAQELFEAIGTVSIVEEAQMHIVTGISGSGPAYIYYLVEAMEEAAQEEGLDEKTAKQLITQTIIGAGNMLQEQTESAKTLRKNVTSPNGTTAAGIEALQRHNFKDAVVACVKSATRRSEELGEEN